MSPEENWIVGDPVRCVSRAVWPRDPFAWAVAFAIGVMVGMFLASLLIVFVPQARADGTLIPPTPQEEADIQTWIPQTCCWTNKCCFKVPRRAVTALSGNRYRVEATGQVIARTAWSRDGQTWRCTCDYDPAKGWVAHEKANTRCLFPVADSF